MSKETMAELRNLFNAKLDSSGISTTAQKKLNLQIVTTDEMFKLGLPAAPAFRIPYFTTAGKITKFCRYRYLKSPATGFAALRTKQLRYIQPKNTDSEVYMPPLIPWNKILKMEDEPIIITEGELKAACACEHGFSCMGLGGVWSFKSTKNIEPLLPIFSEFEWGGRQVFIIFDSDAGSNAQVMKAENSLCRELSMLGARVYVVRLPALQEKEKTGLDDYLVSEGEENLTALMENAVEWKSMRTLFKLNTEVCYVRNPGSILRLNNNQRMSVESFKNHAYSTWKQPIVKVDEDGNEKLQEKPAAPMWVDWPYRHEVEAVTYVPGKDRFLPDGTVNVWPGWNIQPRTGPVKPWVTLLDYLFGDEREARQWFERWCAYPLQNPGVKMFTSSVLWGKRQGTGKTLIGYSLMQIYGKNSTEIKDTDLEETHNEWAENKQFVLGDEITGGDKRGSADRLKSMITQRQIRLNPKYIPSYTIPDCINYLFTSNHADAFFLEDSDRRFFVHHVDQSPLPTKFYEEYDAWLWGDGPAFLFQHLLELDTGNFNPKASALYTRSKGAMIDDNRSELERWATMLYNDPSVILRIGNLELEGDLWSSKDLKVLYDPADVKKTGESAIGKAVGKAGFHQINKGEALATSKGHLRLFVLRNEKQWLNAGRTKWIEHYETTRGNGGTKSVEKKRKF